MVSVRLLRQDENQAGPQHALGALDLARRLPQLVIAAKEVAASVRHGVHGRRRAGVGESFWQFRPFVMGEPTTNVDWRRSARDDHTYVREREWEAAHTVWLWVDRSPSMGFISSLGHEPKVDRAIVLGLAAADLLVRGGERVGLLGVTRPMAVHTIVDRLAEAMLGDKSAASAELPAAMPLEPRTQVILISDLLSEPTAIETTIATLASRGARGHVLIVADPVEETFPFEGHLEFADVDSAARLRVGDAQSFRDVYTARLAAHRDRIAGVCNARGWSFALHRTDQPASAALLALQMRLEAMGSVTSSRAAGA